MIIALETPKSATPSIYIAIEKLVINQPIISETPIHDTSSADWKPIKSSSSTITPSMGIYSWVILLTF